MSAITPRLRRLAGFTFAGLVLGAAGLPHLACAASDDEVLAALAGVCSLDLLSQNVVQSCAAEASHGSYSNGQGTSTYSGSSFTDPGLGWQHRPDI